MSEHQNCSRPLPRARFVTVRFSCSVRATFHPFSSLGCSSCVSTSNGTKKKVLSLRWLRNPNEENPTKLSSDFRVFERYDFFTKLSAFLTIRPGPSVAYSSISLLCWTKGKIVNRRHSRNFWPVPTWLVQWSVRSHCELASCCCMDCVKASGGDLRPLWRPKMATANDFARPFFLWEMVMIRKKRFLLSELLAGYSIS